MGGWWPLVGKRLVGLTLATVVVLMLAPVSAKRLTTTIIQDDFTDTLGTALTAHTISPTNVPATSWSAVAGPTGVLKIGTNSVLDTGGDYGWCVLDTGQGDGTLTVTLNSIIYTVDFYVTFRFSDSSNMWRLNFNTITNTTLTLYKTQAGSTTLAGTAAFVASFSTDYTVQVVLNGSSISTSIVGVGGTTITVTDSFNATATKAGLEMGPSVTSAGTADNFLFVTGAASPTLPAAILNAPIICCRDDREAQNVTVRLLSESERRLKAGLLSAPWSWDGRHYGSTRRPHGR